MTSGTDRSQDTEAASSEGASGVGMHEPTSPALPAQRVAEGNGTGSAEPRAEENGSGSAEPHADEAAHGEPTTDEQDADEFDDGEDFPEGPLHGDVVHRIAAARTAVLSTSDRDGHSDVSVLSGERCFLRVLDAHRFAFPDEGLEPESAARGNLSETPRLAMLLVDDGGSRRRGLHLNGTATVVPATELATEHPDLPEQPVPGRATDVWVVVEVGDAYPLDGSDVPPIGAAGAPAPAAAPAPGRRRTGLLVVVLALVVLLLAAAALGLAALLPRPGEGAAEASPPPPAAPAQPTGPVVLRGTVSGIVDPATVVVDVAGQPQTVSIVGISAATVPACARPASLDYARRTLAGQTVTLVPDPTLPQQPGVTRAYAVLGTQLSYTDAAISNGQAPVAGPSQYRTVFEREQQEARDAGVGMWGPPCVP